MDSYLDVESSSMHAMDSDTTLIITDDLDIVQIQSRLLSVLKKILRSETEAFKMAKSGGYNRMGYLLNEAISGLTVLEKSLSEYQQLHPTIRLFSRTLKAYNLTDLSVTEATTVNDVLRRFRDEAQSTAYKRQLRNFQRTASKNLAGALAYVDHLFEHHSRLQVIRVDLSYQKVIVKNNVVSADMTRLHRKRLFKCVQSYSLFEHWVMLPTY